MKTFIYFVNQYIVISGDVIKIYREALIMAAAGAAGVAQDFVLVNFVEPAIGTSLLPMLGGFGRTKNLMEIVFGAAAIGIGMYGMKTGKFIRDPRIQYAMMAYGGTSLALGLVSGVTTSAARARAFPRTAAVRAVPVGAGYSMVNKREQNIL